MERLPSVEERQWLTHALKKLIARRGAEILDTTPLVEPTNDWFPEPWAMTAAHGHRLAQRMMHYAGLGNLRVTLSAYEPVIDDPDNPPWDAKTAGWFAGIADGRAYFGLHVDQFSDPEAAAGVMAHEVAHAWRAYHRLGVDDREKEELLTDVTTIVLGFGILSTNNTDRYRSSGDYSETRWSVSSAGYLPPQAMAYLLALWCAARGRPPERKAIERHLEPNQRGFFRAAMEELREQDVRALLNAGAPAGVREPAPFVPAEPSADELSEPPRVSPTEVNRGVTVYRERRPWPRADVCSECATPVEPNVAICKGCGGTLGRRVNNDELRRIRLEELERRAASVEFIDCDSCQPEQPCDEHGGGAVEEDDEVPDDVAVEPAFVQAPRSSGGVRRIAIQVAAAVMAIALALAWWRQNHVAVYFDNALGRPLTLRLDGETFALAGRPPLLRELKPGRHRIVILDGPRELERFDAEVRRQRLDQALFAPRFYVYNTGGFGIYRRAKLVYSTVESEQTYDETLFAFDRWIEQERVDFSFTPAPDELSASGGNKVRTSFEVAHDLGFRELAFAWFSQGRSADAERALRKGLELAPCDDSTREDMVNLLNTVGDAARTLAEAKAWVAACGAESLQAHRVYQNVVLRDGDRVPLVGHYRERAAQQPTAMNHYLYGRLLQGEAAIAEHRAALRLDPKLVWPKVAVGHELLKLERDAEAYEVLAESLLAEEPHSNAASLFALAAVALQKQNAALDKLVEAKHLDTWEAHWILARSKRDWASANVYLTDKERGERTPETRILRAKLDWEAGGVRESILADLRRDEATRDAAELLAIEDALENGRTANAVAIDAKWRKENGATIHSIYALQAAMLAKLPDVAEQARLLRLELEGNRTLLAILDAAEGRIGEAAVRERLVDDDVHQLPHAWFALAVHAQMKGDRENATRLFRKASARALDRELPYRLAALMADRVR